MAREGTVREREARLPLRLIEESEDDIDDVFEEQGDGDLVDRTEERSAEESEETEEGGQEDSETEDREEEDIDGTAQAQYGDNAFDIEEPEDSSQNTADNRSQAADEDQEEDGTHERRLITAIYQNRDHTIRNYLPNNPHPSRNETEWPVPLLQALLDFSTVTAHLDPEHVHEILQHLFGDKKKYRLARSLKHLSEAIEEGNEARKRQAKTVAQFSGSQIDTADGIRKQPRLEKIRAGSFKKFNDVHGPFFGDAAEPEMSGDEENHATEDADSGSEEADPAGNHQHASDGKRKADSAPDAQSRPAKTPRIPANASKAAKRRYMENDFEIRIADGELQQAEIEAKFARAARTSAWLGNGLRTYAVSNREALEADKRVINSQKKFIKLKREKEDMTKEWRNDSRSE
ncbi:hypothetical protein E8E12_006967 [Didymella heteroderae]|uniref:Uncharacterized protein n=1 Tax=Didymella heteroderae TaxID=1769908 RepID=A0A9P4WNB8_9PLEO|nr:hypothetical protein E8E12_006967 [Didymella heteroderae]